VTLESLQAYHIAVNLYFT